MRQQPEKQLVTSGRFEFERDGHTAFLDYKLGNGVLELIHTEVPHELRGGGVGSEIVRGALDYARENHLKVDVVCPFVATYLRRHPEYSDLVLR
jgi:uncharacterized protein